MATGCNQVGGGMLVRNIKAAKLNLRPGGIGQQSRRSLLREQRLADASGAADQPGVMHAAAVHALAEGGDRFLMAEQRDHSRSSMAAMSLDVTSSGVPEA